MSNNRYTFIFCSRNSNANVITANSVVQYNVNWNSILNTKYKRFHCQFIFKSENSASALTSTGFVNMDFGTKKIYDGQCMTNNIGIIYPVAFNGTNTFYNSTNNDNNDFFIDFPTNNIVTININDFNGVNIANIPHYALILSLQGIED
jgi:hypothetical protein